MLLSTISILSGNLPLPLHFLDMSRGEKRKMGKENRTFLYTVLLSSVLFLYENGEIIKNMAIFFSHSQNEF